MHFLASANVSVLAMQMDLGFNKTEAHMSDPAMHNADVRPDFWRHLAEQQQYKKRRLQSR
jgi:nuclear polyadenylated RNA-binding protein 3